MTAYRATLVRAYSEASRIRELVWRRSEAIATALTAWLPHVLQNVSPWMSANLQKGERWSEVIGRQLSQHHVGIICVTPENLHASWLMFEAGALSKSLGTARVCPVLLGIRPSELAGPLGQFQATMFDKSDMLKLVRSLNAEFGGERVSDAVLSEAFERSWLGVADAVRAAASIQIGAESMHDVLRMFAECGLPEPAFSNSAFFREGFESHAIYSSACAIARQRLYVFGRKNRKLFDKEHADFFAALSSKRAEGLDFKCLFLDPDSPSHVISGAHTSPEFREELIRSIATASARFAAAGLDPNDYARLYRSPRTLAYAVIDDAVAYTPIRFTTTGQADALTKAGFVVINASTAMGEELVRDFLTIWNAGLPMHLVAP